MADHIQSSSSLVLWCLLLLASGYSPELPDIAWLSRRTIDRGLWTGNEHSRQPVDCTIVIRRTLQLSVLAVCAYAGVVATPFSTHPRSPVCTTCHALLLLATACCAWSWSTRPRTLSSRCSRLIGVCFKGAKNLGRPGAGCRRVALAASLLALSK